MDSLNPLAKHAIGINDVIGVGVGAIASHIGSGLIQNFLGVPKMVASLILAGAFWYLKYGYFALGVIGDIIASIIDGGLNLNLGGSNGGLTTV